MYAVVESGGKQHRVAVGDKLRVEKLVCEVGQVIGLDNVLLVAKDQKVTVGAPYVKGVAVKAEVVSHGRAKKIRVIKFKRRKGYHRTIGHRQWFTELKITAIEN